MTSPQRILINENNTYLAIGIKNALHQHFSAQPITVHINADIAARLGDLVIVSTACLTQVMTRKQCLNKMMLLAPCGRNRRRLPSTKPVFYYHEPIKRLLVMAERLVNCSSDVGIELDRKNLKLNAGSVALTQRELDVMNLLSLELSLQQISHLLGSTSKTISAYKRSVMVKLELHNLVEIHRWMQSYFYNIQ